MVFRWRANDDPHIVVFGSSLPSSIKKKVVKVGPLSGSAHAAEQLCFMCEICFYAPMHHVLYPTLKTARGMKAADLIFMSAADIISRQV